MGVIAIKAINMSIERLFFMVKRKIKVAFFF